MAVITKVLNYFCADMNFMLSLYDLFIAFCALVSLLCGVFFVCLFFML